MLKPSLRYCSIPLARSGTQIMTWSMRVNMGSARVFAEVRHLGGLDVPRRPRIPEDTVLGPRGEIGVERARGHQHVVARAHGVRDASAALVAGPHRKTLRARKIVALHRRFTRGPLELR